MKAVGSVQGPGTMIAALRRVPFYPNKLNWNSDRFQQTI